VFALDDLLVRVKVIHRQARLFGVFYKRLIVAGTVGPPLQLTIVEEDLSGIEHLLAFGDRRMPVTVVQQHLSLARAYEVVLLIGNVHAVAFYFVQPVLISKIVEPENIAMIDWLDRAGMQVWVILRGLHYSRRKGLNRRWLFPL